MDLGHQRTDIVLADLEKRIEKLYQEASEEMRGKVVRYFAAFADRDAEQKELLDAGEITEQEYKQWRLAQIGRGKRFIALQNQLAERYTQANTVAMAYVNDATPGIYALNRNYAAYTIEQVSGNADFTLWDEQTVRRMAVEQPDVMPYYPPERAVKRGIDLAWGKRQISAQVTAGILQGESIKKLADRLQTNIPNMNRTSAIRSARTAITGAQNAGRMDSYIAAEKMGIELEREWVATLDGRTRHAHRLLDGQRAKMGKPFHVEGEEIDFPGDPKAAPYLVYNCRCTLIAAVKGVDTTGAKRRARDPETGRNVVIDNMTYSQWEAMKKAEDPAAWETFQKKGQNYSADKKQYREYRDILGKNIPSTFEKFQELKYNNPKEWEYTKGLAKYLRKYPDSNKKFYDASLKMKDKGIRRGVLLPPVREQAFILPEGTNDPYHIMHRMVERNIMDDDLRGYIKDARCMFVQWGGQRQMFIGDNGTCVITKVGEDWLFKTAWSKDNYDEEFDTIMEVLSDAGL